MKPVIFQKSITTHYTLELRPLDKAIWVNNNGQEEYISKQEWAQQIRLTPDPWEAITKVRKYCPFPEELLRKLDTTGFQASVPDEVFKCKTFKEAFPKTEMEVFNLENRLLFFKYDSHQLYALDETVPYSMFLRQHYIGGVTDGRFNLKIAREILKAQEALGLVNNVKLVDIPKYNQFDGNTKALEFSYKLPYEVVKKRLEEVKQDSYPSVRLKEIIPYTSTCFDPLGLSAALLSEQEAAKRKREYSSTEDSD